MPKTANPSATTVAIRAAVPGLDGIPRTHFPAQNHTVETACIQRIPPSLSLSRIPSASLDARLHERAGCSRFRTATEDRLGASLQPWLQVIDDQRPAWNVVNSLRNCPSR